MQIAPRSRRRRYYLGLATASLILLLVGAAVTLGTRRLLHDAEWVSHTHSVLEQIALIYSRTKDAESAQRGHVLTGEADYLGQFYAVLPELQRRGDELIRSVQDHPEQRARALELKQLVKERTDHAETVLHLYERGGLDLARAEIARDTGKRLMQRISTLTADMEALEQDLLDMRRDASDQSALSLQATTTAGIVISLALVGLIFVMILRENRDRRLAERRSEQAGVELRETVERLRLATEQTRELSRYAGMLQSCRSVDEALEISRQTFSNLLPDLGGAIFLNRASQDLSELKLRWGHAPAPGTDLLRPEDCWGLRRGQPYLVPDLHRGSRCAHVPEPPPEVAASSLCLPLAAQGDSLGFIHLHGAGESASNGQALAQSAAEQLSLALRNLKLQESLRVQSIRDPLTGLFNRRYLEESLDRELSRCGRRSLPLSVMMLDVDHFKRFNDTHGHDGGDALLAQFAALLQSHCRADDIACRFGGEEFTLILPEMAPAAAQERAEAIRSATEALRVMHLRQPLSPVTLSIGVACFPAHGVHANELLRAADGALYQAKHGGRNRVEFA